MRVPWTQGFESQCHRLITAVCDDGAARPDRDRAWRDLLTRLGEPLERWANRSALLRQCGLAGEDDARTVMVAMLERLADDDFANLRLFLDRRPAVVAPQPADDDLACVDGLDDLARDDGDDDTVATPLRAWLITLLRFVERDHVRSRLGWGEGDKRSVGTGADRMPTDGGDLAIRPPITDALTLAQVAGEVRTAMAALPDDMRRALELWMHDRTFTEIATEHQSTTIFPLPVDLVRPFLKPTDG